MNKIDQNKRSFIKMAGMLGASAACCPLFSLMLPESALAGPSVPLRIANQRTGEKYEVELFEGANWNKNALLVCNWMMRDWRQSQTVTCDPKLYAALYVIQRRFNIEGYIDIKSGFRSETTNAMLRAESIRQHGGHATPESPAVNSQHIQARAVDFALPNVTPLEVSRHVLTMGIGGVGNYDTFTHMDTASVRKWGRGI